MVVYLDVLFFTNVLMDWITLLAAARLGGAKVRQGRLALASLLGGVYAAGAALLPLLAALPVRVLAGVALCLAAFCGERALLRLGGLYFLTAAAFAGLAAALGAVSERRLLFGAGYYFAVPLRLLLLAAALGYTLSGILLRGDAKHGSIRRDIRPLTICFSGRERRVRVLEDTGHSLTEPVSGKPVLILCRGEAALLLNDPLALRSRAIPRRRDRERPAAVFPPGPRAGGRRKNARLRVRRRSARLRVRTVRGPDLCVKGRKS